MIVEIKEMLKFYTFAINGLFKWIIIKVGGFNYSFNKLAGNKGLDEWTIKLIFSVQFKEKYVGIKANEGQYV